MAATARDLFTKRQRAVDRLPPEREAMLHFAVAKLLRDYAHPEWRWTHIGHGEKRDEETARKLARMGLAPGWPDFLLIAPWGLAHALELKSSTGRMSEAQEAFAAWCITHNVPHAVCRTMDEVLAVCGRWDCLRIRVTRGRG